ncbi:hypothetical protein [Corynebacterium gerontici]|nr:hypothetical protein [Corynebacterium gerontici]
MFAVLLPLICTVLALVLVGGYFFSGKLKHSTEMELKAGTIATLKEPVPSSAQSQASTPAAVPAQEWNHLINSVTHCHGEYAYAGTDGTDYVSICVTPEGLLYQGYVGNGILRRPAIEVSPGVFEVNAGAHTIRVNDAMVEVLDELGDLKLELQMSEWLSR